MGIGGLRFFRQLFQLAAFNLTIPNFLVNAVAPTIGRLTLTVKPPPPLIEFRAAKPIRLILPNIKIFTSRG